MVDNTNINDIKANKIKEFKKREELANTSYDYRQLAVSVADNDYLGDKTWARELFKKAVELTKYSQNFTDIAVSVADNDCLGDKNWARELFKKTVENVNNTSRPCFNCVKIAELVANNDYLGDKTWAIELYEKAEELAENTHEYRWVAESIAKDDTVCDKTWARKLYKEAEELAEDTQEYMYVAEFIAKDDTLCDKTWIRKLYKKAEKKLLENFSKSYGDVCWFSKKLEEELEDKAWAYLIKQYASLVQDGDKSKLGGYNFSLRKKEIATDHQTSRSVIEKLITDDYRWVRETAASHPEIDKSRISELIKTGDRYILKGILKNPNCDEKCKKIINKLLTDINKYPVQKDKYTIGHDEGGSYSDGACGTVTLEDIIKAIVDNGVWSEFAYESDEEYSSYYSYFGKEDPATHIQYPDGTKSSIEIETNSKNAEKQELESYAANEKNGTFVSLTIMFYGFDDGWKDWEKYTIELEYEFDANKIKVEFERVVEGYSYQGEDGDDFESDECWQGSGVDSDYHLYVIIKGKCETVDLKVIRNDMREQNLDPSEEGDVRKYLKEKYGSE